MLFVENDGHLSIAPSSQQLLLINNTLPSQVSSLWGCRGWALRLRATPFASRPVLQHSLPSENAYGWVKGQEFLSTVSKLLEYRIQFQCLIFLILTD